MARMSQRFSAVSAAAAVAFALGAPPPASAQLRTLTTAPDSSTPETQYEVGAATDSTQELSDRTLALLGDIDSNPAFSERTKEILGEQVRSGFDHFAKAAPDPDTALSPNADLGVKEGTFSLESVGLLEPFSNQFVEDDCSATPCEIPEVWDIEAEEIYLTWEVISSAALANLDEYIDGPGGDGRSMKVFLNGVQQTQASNGAAFGDFYAFTTPAGCGSDDLSPCLYTIFRRHAWYPGPPPWPAWNVVFELWGTETLAVPIMDVDEYGNPISISSVQVLEGVRSGTVQPRQYLQSFWTDTIGATLMSPRCTNCHAMDTEQNIYAQHGGIIDGTPIVQVPSILVPGKFVYHCSNCHEGNLWFLGAGSPFDESKWATPTEALDIDWAQIMNDHPYSWPSEICGRMISNMPDPATRHEHFHEDARLFWAVQSGEIPPPHIQVLPTASPNNHSEFLRRFDIWNEHGAHCP